MPDPSPDDPDEVPRYTAPYNPRHTIPTISKFRAEKQARVENARKYEGGEGGDAGGDATHHGVDDTTASQIPGRDAHDEARSKRSQQQPGDGPHRESRGDASAQSNDSGEAIDTSERSAASTDPKQRRKDLKKGREERAERQVTDPVTHLPVTIHDFTSEALKDIPENEEPYGSTAHSSTGLANKKKSSNELHNETETIRRGHESMEALFPPPDLELVKAEMVGIHRRGAMVGAVGVVIIVVGVSGLQAAITPVFVDRSTGSSGGGAWSVTNISIALLVLVGISGAVALLGWAIGDWMSKRIEAVWDEETWDASRTGSVREQKADETETVAWLNSLLGNVWPLINPDLFISLADTLEDVMQASLPKMVKMVSVNDIGQGSESIRILGIRWLPTGAAACSVSEDGTLKDAEADRPNDREVAGEGEEEDADEDSDHKSNKTQQNDDGTEQQVAEGLEAEEGDFVNIEVAFAYRARSKRRSMRDRAKDAHLYIAFYLPGKLKVPVWVDLRGVVGTLRMRLQLCPDPPFFSLATMTFLGQPKVDISCTPLSKHAVNIMDVPLISNFVQSAVDAAMAEYVAPKSLNLDLKDMLAGDDFKKDTHARGVIVVHIKRGYDFKTADTGIPLIKDGSSDPYVSVGWAKFGKPMFSTRILMSEMEPYWDETAYLLVTPEEVNVRELLRLQLWDSDRMTADDDLGRIEVDLKDLMRGKDSRARMHDRTDGFAALQAGQSMPGKLEWSVGYFPKAPIQDCQLEKQTFDPVVRSRDQLKEKVKQICDNKLREANIKEGRHKQDADELEQQRAQEMKSRQDAMIVSAPPPDGLVSGIFSIQIHQITGLELEQQSKTKVDAQADNCDEEEEGEELPSAYCTVIINHSKVFKTRVKPKNAKPFYNAGTERFIADWRNTEVYISVRDARVHEDDAVLGIVHLQLADVFRHRAQINGFYPLTGGIGYGRVRLSMVWRSVQLRAPRESLGWEYGTLRIRPSVAPSSDLPNDLRALKLRFDTDLGRGKMYATKQRQQAGDAGEANGAWGTKNGSSIHLPVRRRYCSSLAIEFRQHGALRDRTPAFAVLWLKELGDNEEIDITIPVWQGGDFERAAANRLPESFTGEGSGGKERKKVGSITLKVKFAPGLGPAHQKWASKNQDLRDVIEVVQVARDNLEDMDHEDVVGGADDEDSSDDDGEGNEHDAKEGAGEDGAKAGLVGRLKNFKSDQDALNRRHRGIMQWKGPRTAEWASHKIENAGDKFTGMFKRHVREPDVETEA